MAQAIDETQDAVFHLGLVNMDRKRRGLSACIGDLYWLIASKLIRFGGNGHGMWNVDV